MGKLVTIGIQADETFIRSLLANTTLSGSGKKDALEPMEQLALIAQMEFRGALSLQIDDKILPMWKPHLNIVPELRKVEETA